MYRIIKDYVWSNIDPQLPVDINISIHTTLRYHPSGYQRTWKYKNKQWDGWTYVYDIVEQKFRTGLISRVSKLLELNNLEYEIIDIRKNIVNNNNAKDIKINLNPHQFQLDAANSTLNKSHGIISSPTGTGKTIIMALITKLHAYRTLIVVNSRVLLDQTHEFFDKITPGGAGIVGSGSFELKDITIATIQSLSSILGIGKKQNPTSNSYLLKEWFEEVGLVIHDEVHEADNASVNGLYSQLKCPVFIGTTATPYSWAFSTEKTKNLEMEQHFGTKLYDSRDIVDFIKLGLTVPLYINRFATPIATQYINYSSKESLRENPTEYAEVITNQIINNDERIHLLTQKVKELVTSGMSCYVFYNRIEYGKKLCAAMSNLDPVMIQGSTPRNKRNNIFKALNSKELLLVVSDIGSYGLNIRSLDSIILSYPVKDFRQLKGRVCRSYPNKNFGMVLDPIDHVPFLDYHAKMRKSQAVKDGDMVVGY